MSVGPKRDSMRSFFVVGTAKAGTTSIHYYLEQHPEIYVHPYKDIACYFCAQYGMPVTFKEFLGFMFPEGRSFKVSGDVCSDYLFEPNSAREISEKFPKANIIAILRNPADRAFSLYRWMVREGYEYLPTFEEALAAEEERISRKCKGSDLISPSKQGYLYLSSGYYSHQVRRYLDHFPRHNVLFMKYDDLLADPLLFVRRIYSFLDVDPSFAPRLEVLNKGRWPISIAFQYFCRRKLARVLPNRIVFPLLWLNQRRSRGARLDPVTRRQLIEKYTEDIRKTADLTGLDLSDWLK